MSSTPQKFNEELPPGIDALLFDMDFMENLVAGGNHKVDPDEVENDFDAFLSGVFLEATKTEDGVVREIARHPSVSEKRFSVLR